MEIYFDYWKNGTRVRSVKHFRKFESAYHYIQTRIHWVAVLYVRTKVESYAISGEYEIKDFLRKKVTCCVL